MVIVVYYYYIYNVRLIVGAVRVSVRLSKLYQFLYRRIKLSQFLSLVWDRLPYDKIDCFAILRLIIIWLDRQIRKFLNNSFINLILKSSWARLVLQVPSESIIVRRKWPVSTVRTADAVWLKIHSFHSPIPDVSNEWMNHHHQSIIESTRDFEFEDGSAPGFIPANSHNTRKHGRFQ